VASGSERPRCRSPLDSPSEPVEIEITKLGYGRQRLTVRPGLDKDVTVKLVKAPPSTAPEPKKSAPGIAPKPSKSTTDGWLD
jgi:hypothetical protein